MRRAKATHCAKSLGSSAGLLRGTGGGTIGRFTMEQERPSWAVLEGTDRAYKAEPKAAGAQRESEGPILLRMGGTAQPSRREGALP